MSASQVTPLRPSMRELLDRGDALDITKLGAPVPNQAGVWRLGYFREDKLYCDPRTRRWVQSVGRHKVSGAVNAALDGRYAADDEWYCLYQR